MDRVKSGTALPAYKLILSIAIIVGGTLTLQLFFPGTLTIAPAKEGTVDLRWWSSGDQAVVLQGMWAWFPGQLVYPGSQPGIQAQTMVPGVYGRTEHGNASVSTYKINLLFSDPPTTDTALLLPSASGSQRVFVNGVLAGERGIVSENPLVQQMAGSPEPFILRIESTVAEILIQQSTFGESEKGLHAPPVFGSSTQVQRFLQQSNSIDTAIIIATIFLALYLAIIYLFRPAESSLPPVIFFATTLAIRQLFNNGTLILEIMPNLGPGFLERGSFLFLVISFLALLLYVKESFPAFFSQNLGTLALVISTMVGLSLILFPINWLRTVIILWQGWQLLAFFTIFIVLVKAANHGQEIAWAFLISLVFIQIMYTTELFSTITLVNPIQIMGPGLLIFFLIHATLFSWRFVDSYEKNLELSAELRKLIEKQDEVQESLEKTVVSRTQALTNALEEANRANSSKSKFLANVSHEIRTPLNGIIGFTELLRDNPDSPSRKHFYKLILAEAQRLQKLLDQLLNFSKVEANKLKLEFNPFDLHELLETVSATVILQTRMQGLLFKPDIDPSIPKLVRGDPLRLRQILDNLLSNALKFTEEGSISLRVRLRQPMTDRDHLMEFSIEDTGVGIPPDRIEHIFESFEQADSSTTRLFGGSGLGTTIARQLVELMGGDIRLESQVGQGTRFIFWVKLGVAKQGDVPIDLHPESRRTPLWKEYPVAIVAEDYKVNAELVTRHLLGAGWIVRQAENGEEAIQLFKAEPVRLVIMDIQMPIMDGYTATRTIRSLDTKNTPIIGLSANAYEEDRTQCIQAGMDELLAKPVRRNTLLAAIARYVAPSEWNNQESTPIRSNELQDLGKTIPLLTELSGDFPSFLEILSGFLSSLKDAGEVLTRAMDQGDLSSVHRVAHGIKGSSMNLGAGVLEAKARALEVAAKAGDQTQAQECLKEVLLEINLVIASAHYQGSHG